MFGFEKNKFKQNNLISSNQLQYKILYTNQAFYRFSKKNKVILNLDLHKLKSLNEDLILDGLLLLEFFTSLKANISNFKKMYQQINLQVRSVIRKSYLLYFISILKLFYFPVLIRRNTFLDTKTITKNIYILNILNVNIIPFIPDVYFKWDNLINCVINFNFENAEEQQLYLSYLGFCLK